MPQFHVTGRDAFAGHPWQAIIEAESAEAARAFAESRNIQTMGVVPCPDQSALPPDILRMRVPTPKVAGPSTALGRRIKLVLLGVGLALFLIAGVLFVNRAKEHLLREKQVPPQLQPQGNDINLGP